MTAREESTEEERGVKIYQPLFDVLRQSNLAKLLYKNMHTVHQW